MNGFWKSLICIFVIGVTITQLNAQTIPGLIPLFSESRPANDLMYEGHAITASKVQDLQRSGFDISLLNPNTQNDLWKNNSFITTDTLPIQEFTFGSKLASRSGHFRFTVVDGSGKSRILLAHKKAHGYLLKRNLLEKIGYYIPKMGWIQECVIEFKDAAERDIFLAQLEDKTVGNRDRWLKKNSNGLKLTFQDLIYYEDSDEVYNLTLGLMGPGIHQDRRLLRAIYVALALVDAPESINLFSWSVGREYLNHLRFFTSVDLDNTYGTTLDDARWIGRIMAKFSRADFEEIVDKSFLPTSVSKILLEKIISRRNSLLKLLKLDSEFSEISLDSEISHGEELIKGELTKENFEGYAARFSFGDPESPFSRSDVGRYFFLKLQDGLLQEGLNQVSNFLQTKEEVQWKDHLNDLFQLYGSPKNIPLGAWVKPTARGNIILSRDIGMGSYLGTDNQVQLVDSFGASMELGGFLGLEGLPLPVQISGKAGLNVARVYSHIKPIASIKSAMKQPYKNMIIPLFMSNLKNNIIKSLYEDLAIGESLIVTDSLVGLLGLSGGVDLGMLFYMPPKLLVLQSALSERTQILKRIHLYRASKDELHIYDDFAKAPNFSGVLGLNSLIPIMSFSLENHHRGRAKTGFYSINLDPFKPVSPNLERVLKKILSGGYTGDLEKIISPIDIEHKFKRTALEMKLLPFSERVIHIVDHIKMKSTEPLKNVEMIKRYDSYAWGTNFSRLAGDVISGLVDYIWNYQGNNIVDQGSQNAGYSFLGKAKNLIINSEYVKETGALSTKMQYVYNGWKLNRKKLKKFLKKINLKSGKELLPMVEFQDSKSVLLYQVSLDLTLGNASEERLRNFSKSDLVRIAPKLKNKPQFLKRVFSYQKRLINLKEENSKTSHYLKIYHRMLKFLMKKCTLVEMVNLLGEENAVASSKFLGFRRGDELGDQPVISSTIGKLSRPNGSAPMEVFKQKTGILDGELFLSWLLMREL